MVKITKKVPYKEKVIPAGTKVVTEVVCDICGDKATTKCWVCDRDICGIHTNYDPQDPGDYPPKWCPPCKELWEPVRDALNERHWKELEKEERRIKKLSLAHNRGTTVEESDDTV